MKENSECHQASVLNTNWRNQIFQLPKVDHYLKMKSLLSRALTSSIDGEKRLALILAVPSRDDTLFQSNRKQAGRAKERMVFGGNNHDFKE